jgi:hypothetical protein
MAQLTWKSDTYNVIFSHPSHLSLILYARVRAALILTSLHFSNITSTAVWFPTPAVTTVSRHMPHTRAFSVRHICLHETPPQKYELSTDGIMHCQDLWV